MNNKILIGINWLAGVLFTLVLIFAGLMPQAFLNREDWVQTPVLVIVTIGLLIIISGIRKAIALMSPKVYRWTLIILGILIVITQVWVAFNFVTIARADSYFVREQAIALAQGSQTWADYFKVYPNNVNTALFQAAMIKPFLKIGILDPWIYLNILRFIWIDTGLVAGLYILKSWKKLRPVGAFFMFTWLISLPVYSYGLFSYNDPLIMPVVLDVLALGISIKNNNGVIKYISALLVMVLVAFSILMKSNLVVLWIAIFIILVLATILKKVGWKQTVSWLVGSLAMTAMFFMLAHTAASKSGYVKDPNQAVPVTSWISMSFNPDRQGQYSGQDFDQIHDAKTAQQKKQLANDRLINRIKELGPVGLLLHFNEKLGVFLSHGDFDAVNLNRQWVKAPSIYMGHQTFSRFWSLLVSQCWYLALLCGAIWQLFKQRQNLLTIAFLSLFILGLTSFHVFFWEVEPRYALPIFPIIALLGTLGWSTAPQFALSTSKKVAISGLMAAGVLFCTLSVVQTVFYTETEPRPISMQGIGNYFNRHYLQIKPREKFEFSVPLQKHAANHLDLYTKSDGIVTINVHDEAKHLMKVTDNAKSIRQIDYPLTKSQDLHVSIANDGKKSVKYLAGPMSYSADSGKILPYPELNLRWYAQRVPDDPVKTIGKSAPKSYNAATIVVVNAALFMIVILVVTWFEHPDVVTIFTRKK
ncbi:hypothetical protein [Companilactobacillus furfuricola]|uniref:hypothetical protein n=1 Tax=Companilactobacillus furfuricola TaxID=1462575 RepID=UPI000F79FFE5|nr:hypothetical protein [Companilactobacillus furfuricola]